jgi:3D (Asp-Asp-Asp) domain-containing protein
MAFLLLSGAALSAVPAYANAPSTPDISNYSVTLTAYNAVPGQTDSQPLITASGAYSNPEVVAARSQDLADELPFGTIIEILGPSQASNSCGFSIVAPIVGYRVIADTMNVRYTDRVDILFSTKSNYLMADGSTKNAGTILGVCGDSSIRVVGHIDISNPNNLPKTQDELAALVNGTESSIAQK